MNLRLRTHEMLAALAILAGLAIQAQAQGVPSRPADKPAAIVNGESISLESVHSIVRDMQGDTPDAVIVPESERRKRRRQALGALIEDALFRQWLRNGPAINPQEVDQRMAALVKGLDREKRTLDDFCRESGQTVAQLQAKIVALLQWRDYLRDHVTDETLQKYYTEYKAYFDGEMVHAAHIILRVPPQATPAERQAIFNRLAAIRQDILMGKMDFAAAARQHSECPTAPSGGDIGEFPRRWGMVDDVIAKAAFNAKPGDITEIVQSESGYHLIRVLERKPGKPSDFNLIKDHVRDVYQEDLREAVIAQQRKLAKIEVFME